MEMAIMMCAVVIAVCILTNKFTSKLGIPAVLLFMGIGMLFGSEGLVKIPFDDFKAAERICSAALVFIMFYGGFGTNFKAAKQVLGKAVSMATLGVLITAGVTGIFCHLVLEMSIQEGLLIGAVIGSTDAASVFSILRSKNLSLKEGTASLLEVESGSNDPFSYMLTMAVLSWMGGDGQNIFLMIIRQLGFGIMFGVGLGILAVQIFERIEFDIEGADTILMAAMVLFSYAGPAFLGGNGYLSVYLLGMIVGNANFGNKISLIHFFEGIDKLAQILIFFLLGLLVFPSELLPMLSKAVVIFLGLTCIARPLATILLLAPFRSSVRQQLLVSFSGLRGAASIVFAIMVTVNPVYTKSYVFNVVFCVALISVAFQGMLLPYVSRKLDMIDKEQTVMKTFSDYQEEQQMQLLQIRLKEGHKYIGKKIRDLKLGGILAVLIEREGEAIIPRGEVTLKEGDVLVLSGESYQGAQDTVLDEQRIEKGDTRIGKQICEMKNPQNRLIVLIRRSDKTTVIPKGDTKIYEGDTLIFSTGERQG